MSNQNLPDLKRILSLARSYRRACGAHNQAIEREACPERVAETEVAKLLTGNALLRFIETGLFQKRRT